MTCYNCIHYDICWHRNDNFINNAMCDKFKDKSNFIELGITVYEVTPIYRPYDFSMCDNIHSEFVIDFYIQETKLTLKNISDIGKEIFFTIAEAKEELIKRCAY